MDSVNLGRSGLKVSRLCLGTMIFGSQRDERSSIEILNCADELGFTYTAGERATTLVTQLVAWLPLAALLCVLAALVVREEEAPAREVPATPGTATVADEMQALWEERLAHGPRRERARALLARIRSLEAAGDHDGARRLADEMRLL
jgi:hypothetical protein